MLRCWCHAAMAGWMGAEWADALAPSAQSRMRRWQYECERSGGDCAARVEALALRMPHARALRRNDVLKIFANAGVFEFCDELGGAVRYRYLGMIEPDRTHVLWQADANGSRFLSVSDEHGTQTVTYDLPGSSALDLRQVRTQFSSPASFHL